MKNIFYLFILILFSACKNDHADLIVFNAKIYTVNQNFDTATVLVIKKGTIINIGNQSLLDKYQSAEKYDAKGNFIYPGFMDAHCHFTGYAKDKYKLALFGTKSFDEVVAKIIAYSQHNQREWIEGRGWDQNDWEQKEFPTKDTLDKLFPNTPVFLMRIDGHAILCNQKALDIAGIDENTKIEGGEIIKNNGKLTGMLIDNASEIVKKVLPTRSDDEIIQDFIKAENDCASFGLTSVVDCGIDHSTIELLKKAYSQKKLSIKTAAMLSLDEENISRYLHQKPYNDKQLHIIGYKVYADGALGSRGALLLKEYADRHLHLGLQLIPTDSLKKIATEIAKSNYQLCVHAIGDSANRMVLKIYAEVLQGENDRRWRIEHAQVIDEGDFHYFGEYQIVPSVQPTHATSDMYWAQDRVGAQRIKNAYAYQKLLMQNQWIPLGTDFPVEGVNPLQTFYAAVFRIDQNHFPQNGFEIENALTREQALRGMTIWAAKSAFEEKEKGSLEIGKSADFCVLPIDLMTASPAEISQAKVMRTFINGRLIFENKSNIH
ncbi:MAG TPA: amidohydrolase [Chitinophagaceae bacterium]|nr:MAG: amidohydrolase [Bacteroidetes bacterium OLB11]HMN32737.1 amidohydrolase [Chitinophagaceae bacterium]